MREFGDVYEREIGGRRRGWVVLLLCWLATAAALLASPAKVLSPLVGIGLLALSAIVLVVAIAIFVRDLVLEARR